MLKGTINIYIYIFKKPTFLKKALRLIYNAHFHKTPKVCFSAVVINIQLLEQVGPLQPLEGAVSRQNDKPHK